MRVIIGIGRGMLAGFYVCAIGAAILGVLCGELALAIWIGRHFDFGDAGIILILAAMLIITIGGLAGAGNAANETPPLTSHKQEAL
jgi:hypothetical protein